MRVSVIVLPVCFSILWVLLGARSIDIARRHDFLNLYTGASLALEGRFADLHDKDTQLRREQQLVPGTTELVPFVRPAFYALLISPLATLPYSAAFWVWLAIQVMMAVACMWWGCRRFGADAVFFASMYAPMAMSIPHGQDALFILAIVVASFALAEKDRPEAGVVLSLGLIKFHLFVLWPLLLAVQRKWRMLGWFIGGGAALALSSILLSGPGGALAYLDLLTRKDLARLTPSPEKNVNLAAVLLNFGSESGVLYGVLAALTVVIAAMAVRRAPLWKLFAMATSGSLLVVPHAYSYDATMLMLPLWCGMFLSTRPLTRIVSATLCLPVVFFFMILEPPFAAALGIAVIGFFLATAFDAERAIPAPGMCRI